MDGLLESGVVTKASDNIIPCTLPARAEGGADDQNSLCPSRLELG